MSVVAPAATIEIAGSPWRRCRRAVVLSGPERCSAHLWTLPRDRSPARPGDTVTVSIGATAAYRGAVWQVSDQGVAGWRIDTEAGASQAMRSDAAAVAPASWRDVRPAVVLAHIFGPGVDAAGWPDRPLPRFSLPPCTPAWAAAALERASGIRATWAAAADGTLRIGRLADTVRATSLAVAASRVLRRPGALRIVPALPAGRLDVVTLGGERGWVDQIRTVLRPEQHRSAVVLRLL